MGQNTTGMEFTRLSCYPEHIFVILSASEESQERAESTLLI